MYFEHLLADQLVICTRRAIQRVNYVIQSLAAFTSSSIDCNEKYKKSGKLKPKYNRLSTSFIAMLVLSSAKKINMVATLDDYGTI